MIYLTVDGFTPKQTAEITEAVHFFTKALGLSRFTYTLDVEHARSLDVQGECVSEEDKKDPRWFTISLRGKKTDDDIIKTLAHEMVHVKQYMRNELSKQFRLSCGGLGIGTKWQGEWWEPKSHEDSYFDSPWEIEAYGREVGLYQRWFHRNDK